MSSDEGDAGTRLPFLRRADDRRRPRFRRGVSLLPSLFTMGNLFCGYACIVYAMRGEYETAAPFIGFAIVLDMLDGRIARLTGTGQRLRRGVRFARRRHLVRHRAGDPVVRVGACSARPTGMGRRLPLRHRRGDAAGALQHPERGRRRQALLRRHAEPGGGRRSRRDRLRVSGGHRATTGGRCVALAMVLVPAVLMVSTIRFRSFKTIDLRSRRPYTVLLLIAGGIVLIATEPRWVLVAMAYTYLASAFVGLGWTRLRARDGAREGGKSEQPPDSRTPAAS